MELGTRKFQSGRVEGLLERINNNKSLPGVISTQGLPSRPDCAGRSCAAQHAALRAVSDLVSGTWWQCFPCCRHLRGALGNARQQSLAVGAGAAGNGQDWRCCWAPAGWSQMLRTRLPQQWDGVSRPSSVAVGSLGRWESCDVPAHRNHPGQHVIT